MALDGGVVGRAMDHHLVFEPLFHVEFQGPLAQSMDLNDQLMASVLTRLPCVIGLNQVDFEGLVEDDYHVLHNPVHFNDQVHHVFSVLLVCLDLVQLLKIILVSLETKHFEQAVLALVHYGVQTHHVGLRLHFLVLVALYFFNHGLFHGAVDLSTDQFFEFHKVGLLFLDHVQITEHSRVQVFHYWLKIAL